MSLAYDLANPVSQAPTKSVQRAAAQSFRPDIEGLRGVAVLLVVLFHAEVPYFSGGFVGVDAFYVLSGYLITGLLTDEIARTGRVDFAHFYARRARRLLPAAAVVLLASLLASVFVFSPIERARFALDAVATSSYASNVWFARWATDYFSADNAQSPFLHTWSLAVEEQFYLAWPVLVLWALRWRRRRVLIVVLAALSAISLALCVWLTPLRQPFAFFLTPTRAWEFGAGALASVVPRAALSGRSRSLIGWLGLAALIASGLVFTSATQFPGLAALIPVLGTSAVLLGGAHESERGCGVILARRPVQWFGRLSYSLYLWHWPLLILALALGGRLSLGTKLLVMMLALGLSWLTYKFVESPIRARPRLVATNYRALVMGGVLTAAGIAASCTAWVLASRALGSPEQQGVVRARAAWARLSPKTCIAGFTDVALVECELGDPKASQTLVLLGDSHAAQWGPAIDRIAHDRGWRVVTLLKSSCPAARVPVYNMRLHRDYEECRKWREAALLRAKQIHPIGVVISQFAAREPVDVDRSGAPVTISANAWRDGLRSTMLSIDSAGVPSILLQDTPMPGFDVPTCVSRAVQRRRDPASTCSVRRSNALNQATAQAERAAAAGIAHVAIVDMTGSFCGAELCPAEKDGIVVYRDANHVATDYALSIAPRLAERFPPLAGTQ